ncbi:MAG: hypothetical protein NTX28_03840 [Novosphingobium sp.]|nr:hypothetical protein [Novosphingobium sp.]
MRSDVKTLLEKLGKSQFRYKEFADRFSDLDTWPVFESILRDPRVFNRELADAPTAPGSTPLDSRPIGAVLSQKYGGAPNPLTKAPVSRPAADVRTLLSRISSAIDKGTI